MNGLFVDTAGWIACADEDESTHRLAVQARTAWLANGGVLVTTDYVLDETLTLMRRHLGLAATEAWWEQAANSPRLRWEWIAMARADKARDIFFRYRDKDYSFTDCTSFVVMKELKLKHALTIDKHFTQMGFHILP